MHEGMRWRHHASAALLMVGLASITAAQTGQTTGPAGTNTTSTTATAKTTTPPWTYATPLDPNGTLANPRHGVPIPLWPQGAPMAQGSEPIDVPSITPYLPATPAPTGTGVIICPGGSYARLAMDHEGRQVADYFNHLGITAFVLVYRLGPKYHHPVELTDAQRAIRLVRTFAPQLELRADRIGLMGFSAGGHLASTAGTHSDPGRAEAPDPIDRASSRPDFLVLGYPVITMTEAFVHAASRRNLLGETPDPALLDLLSNDKQVTAQTPPTFLFHTDEDKGVPVENSVAFYLALRRAGVPAELHVYQRGGHGVGLAKKDPVVSSWPDRLTGWLQVRGLLPGGEMTP